MHDADGRSRPPSGAQRRVGASPSAATSGWLRPMPGELSAGDIQDHHYCTQPSYRPRPLYRVIKVLKEGTKITVMPGHRGRRECPRSLSRGSLDPASAACCFVTRIWDTGVSAPGRCVAEYRPATAGSRVITSSGVLSRHLAIVLDIAANPDSATRDGTPATQQVSERTTTHMGNRPCVSQQRRARLGTC
jgi:hypothetical protein